MPRKAKGQVQSESVRRKSGSADKPAVQETEAFEVGGDVGEHPATATVAEAETINLGNYESLRIGVTVALPCKPEDIDRALDAAQRITEERMRDIKRDHGLAKSEEGKATTEDEFDL